MARLSARAEKGQGEELQVIKVLIANYSAHLVDARTWYGGTK